jgi:hypothetical protein
LQYGGTVGPSVLYKYFFGETGILIFYKKKIDTVTEPANINVLLCASELCLQQYFAININQLQQGV